jgi:hypothetical protein
MKISLNFIELYNFILNYKDSLKRGPDGPSHKLYLVLEIYKSKFTIYRAPTF